MASSAAAFQPFRFKDLPGEVRDMVYPHLLVHRLNEKDDEDTTEVAKRDVREDDFDAETARDIGAAPEDSHTKHDLKPRALLHPNILLANHQINAEATHLLYTSTPLTTTITAAGISNPNSPALDPGAPHRNLSLTRDWTVIIDLIHSAPKGWDTLEWNETDDSSREPVNEIKKNLQVVCDMLAALPTLSRLRIKVEADFHWEVLERWYGVGLDEILEPFVVAGVKVAGEVEIEGTRKLVKQKRMEEVRGFLMRTAVVGSDGVGQGGLRDAGDEEGLAAEEDGGKAGETASGMAMRI